MITQLDQEFKRYSELHTKMVFALALYHNPELYKHKVFKKVNMHEEIENEDKRLSKILDEITSLRGKKLFNDIYIVCWETAKDYMDKKGFFKNRIY